ncbi:Alpha-acetolactate decarboxylase [Pleurostoma richardsiae]|uniref:Alpha-acetolactate decarboxylase n=1 Tax=Pleurostoma richardsiae TaxID=41990 RepID=A0AA38RSA3_9PEZI|nr:Alpha-acetolactate decarboxylase [Pleurostoma richardsiae]
MATNELFQFSIVSALMDGVASHGLPVSTILANGDHGLGTFRNLVGELIILDGKAYRMNPDGSITHIGFTASTETISPFAMITRFSPTVITKADLPGKAKVPGKEALFELLSHLLPGARNHYLAIRVEGVFKSVTVRTVGGQREPHEGLADVGKHQVSHTFTEAMTGTIIGFRSPPYMQGVSVAGDHLHFISEDRARGGHLLAFETAEKVEVAVAPIWTVHLELPRDDAEFNEATLKGDSEGIKAVEG